MRGFAWTRCHVCKEFYWHLATDRREKIAAGQANKLQCPECNRTGTKPKTMKSAPSMSVRDRVIAYQEAN